MPPDLAEQILILASRYFRELGEQATDAVAQLLVLAADLTGASLTTEQPAAAKTEAPSPKTKKPAPASTPAKKAAPAPKKAAAKR